MTATYRLHYAPDNASLCVRLALNELGVRYETALVDRAARAQKSPAYRALNPNGLIPVLETPDGPLFETGAILLWLADTHGGLVPAPQDADRGAVLTWLFWLANTLHPTLQCLFHPEDYAPSAAVALRQRMTERLAELLVMLDDAQTPWLDRPSVLSCYLAPMLRWMALYPEDSTDWFDLVRYPRLRTLARTMEARPAAQAAIVAEGLGDRPFSCPKPCNPPEGSAH